ncbi:enoyl-CoA hydratase/carnithine racemase [Trinickia symbiotica]|nr:enoyl-CoA hydratase [Trinickia symbiotica]PPK41104.1 enoyl-CoA hydratase/carnithine racemase [Trinickia symbiotica]
METDKPGMRLEDEMQAVGSHADGTLLAGRIDQVGVILFNRPEKLNAINMKMWDGVAEALDVMERDSDVRVVIYAGAGGKAFTAGADISEFAARRATAQADTEFSQITARGRDRLANFPKPSIACIQGFCLGGGMVVAMQADLRIASHDAVFGIPVARLGIHYPLEYTELLISLVGPSRARLMLFTARRFNSREAFDIGLVDVLAPKDVVGESVDLARTIANNAPLSVQASKFTIEQALKEPVRRDLASLDAYTQRCVESADYREGQQAFREKRNPVFTGA